MVESKKIYFPKRDKPIRVAFFSNGPNMPTGYAKVIREIILRLWKDPDFEVVVINENMFNAPPTQWMGIPMVGLDVPARPLPNGGMEPAREMIAQAFTKLLPTIQPDIVFFLEDSFTLRNFGFEGVFKIPSKRVFYIPLDGDWIPDIGLRVTRSMDKIVAMSMFTQNALAKEGFDSDMIWHGVDLELFHPVPKEYQNKLKEKYGYKPDDFVIFNYGRNSNIRKNNQGMMWIMAKYLSTAPKNHKFLFHTLQPGFEGNDLFDYKNRHLTIEFGKDIVDRLEFTKFGDNGNGQAASDKDVAEMIQMSDLVITASTGEGFGLIMAEAMACAKPVISTDYTTPWELLIDTRMGIKERGWVVPVGATFVAGLNTEHAYVNKEEFVKLLHQIVHNPKEMLERGLRGRVFAEKYLNWDYIVEQWKKVFKELM